MDRTDAAPASERLEPHPLEVPPPARMARLVEEVGVGKVLLPIIPTLTLGVLAGASIAFGSMFFTVTNTGSELGFGLPRLLGGLAFSLCLILVIIGGAELFRPATGYARCRRGRYVKNRD